MFTPLLKTFAAAALLGAAALTGCTSAADATSSTASALTGTIDQATFPAAITSITVARDDGTTTLASVLADGTFTALLESGGTYRLLLSADGTATPVVLDSTGGRLRTEIQITSGGGAVEIGSVRYWDPSVATSSQALETDTTVTTTPTAPTCVDGVTTDTAQPCAGTTAAVDCSVADDMSDGCPDLGATDPTAASGATAATSTNDADAALPMGIPVANAPAQITCGGGHDHAGGPGRGHHHGH